MKSVPSFDAEIPHEGLVDLDLVEGEAAQVAQRRVAGAEIVHRDPHAERLETVQDRRCRAGIGHQHRFGDLQLQAPAGRPVQRRASRTAVTRLADVNCTAETLTATLSPSGQRVASSQARRSTHSPSGTIRPSSSAIGMNSAGETKPRVRMVPAQQRLEAADPVRVEAVDRLVVDLEGLAGEGVAQVALEERAAPGDGHPSRARRTGTSPAPRPCRGRGRRRRSSGASRSSDPSPGASVMPMVSPTLISWLLRL